MRIFVFLFLFIAFASESEAQLSVHFENLTAKESTILVAVYTENEKFATEDVYKWYELPCSKEKCTLNIDDLKSGEYGISAFQDLNGNAVMDKKTFGIPKEPYGFSGNPKIVMSAPSYKDCAFSYDGNSKSIQIKMNQP